MLISLDVTDRPMGSKLQLNGKSGVIYYGELEEVVRRRLILRSIPEIVM